MAWRFTSVRYIKIKTTILCGLTSKISFTMKLHINHIICEIWNIYVYNMQWHWHIWLCNFKMDIGGLHNYSQIKSSLWHDIYDYVDVINVVGLPNLCIYVWSFGIGLNRSLCPNFDIEHWTTSTLDHSFQN
jgi:hypothetical protein